MLRKPSFKCVLSVAIVCIQLLAGCNTVIDVPDPVVLPEVPVKVVNMFNQRFPDATETTMRVVEKDRLWEADYKVNNQRFFAGMDSVKILRRARLESQSVPDSIQAHLNNSILAGVPITDYREEIESFYRPYNVYTARHRYQDKEYLMTWVSGRSYMIRCEPYHKLEFAINSKADLPEKILAVINADRFIHVGGLVFINEKNERRYQVGTSNGDGTRGEDYIFDHAGNLISTTYSPTKVFTSANDAPEHVRAYLDQQYAQHGFVFQMGHQIRTTNGFWFFLNNPNMESLEVVLDPEGKELERTYTRYVNW